MITQLSADETSPTEKPLLIWRILRNRCKDLFFGYGESLWKIFFTYVFVAFVFTILFRYFMNELTFLRTLRESIFNMVGQGSDDFKSIKEPLLFDMLKMLQSTIGVLLTAIFGFVLANRIRNQ